jgi:hypothetical protein
MGLCVPILIGIVASHGQSNRIQTEKGCVVVNKGRIPFKDSVGKGKGSAGEQNYLFWDVPEIGVLVFVVRIEFRDIANQI